GRCKPGLRDGKEGMIQVQRNQWLHFEDLAQNLPGKEDPLELSQVCYGYLSDRVAPPREHGDAHSFDLIIRSKLAAAFVRSSVAPAARAGASQEQDTI